MEAPNDEKANNIAMDMIHSEEELRHALYHLLRHCEEPDGRLQGHECLGVFRMNRKKYVSSVEECSMSLKTGPQQIRAFRSVEQGVLAAHQAGLCYSYERPIASLYATVNPRSVPGALKETHSLYYQWLENKAGASKHQVRKGDRDDFSGSLNKAFEMQMLKSNSRGEFGMVDVDDNDPSASLAQVREAIGDDGIEMIVQTKNGYHVIFHRKKISKEKHKALSEVRSTDVDIMKGSALSCALPGGYQAGHRTRIYSCSCSHLASPSSLSFN